MGHRTRQKFIALTRLVLFTCLLVSCDADWAKRLDHGQPVPSFGFSVALSEPTAKRDLFQLTEKLALTAGFNEYQGRTLADEMFAPDAKIRSFAWKSGDGSDEPYTLVTVWYPNGAVMPTSVELMVHSGSMDMFTTEDWLMFKEWKNALLPRIFPDASIEVTIHPAEFTSERTLNQISEATGIDIPERYRKP